MKDPYELNLTTEEDVDRYSKLAEVFASRLELDHIAVAELRIAASEIASNCINHAGGGKGTLIIDYTSLSIILTVDDSGPGIKDINKAMEDGFTTSTSSLGIGLGAAKRLSDKFIIDNKKDGGLYIRLEKFKR